MRADYLKKHPEFSDDFDYCLSALIHHSILAGTPDIVHAYLIRSEFGKGDTHTKMRPDALIQFTRLGLDFIQACTAPGSNSTTKEPSK